MGKFEKHTSYIFLAGTVILFGISIYLLLSGGSSQGVTWGHSDDICLFIENRNNRHILQLKGDGAQEFLISLSDRKKRLYHLINPKRIVNRQMGFTLKQASGVVEDYFHSSNLLKNGKYVWVTESEKGNYN